MKYYYINTNVKEMGYSPHQIWFKEECAFVSDSPGDETSLEQLKKLEPGDIIFMYVNGSGVMAAGKVCKPCNGCQYTGDERLVQKYAEEEYRDYSESRIPVHWCWPFENNPIEKADLKAIFSKFGESQWWAWPTLIPIQPEIAKQLLKLAKNRAEGR